MAQTDDQIAGASTSPAGTMRVLVLGLGRGRPVRRAAEELVPWLEEHARVVAVDFERTMDLSAVEADLVVVLGGDGAMLRAARQMGYNQIPVIGVNLGKLGFLTEVSVDGFTHDLEQVLAGQYHVTQHLVLECRVPQHGGPDQTHLVFNEVAICAGPPFQIIDIDLSIDGERVTTYSGDGLIVSTPVGSTAHSLSAGGPILRQDIEAVVVTPICPHTLTNRPVVDSADRQYELVVTRASRGTTLIIDGQTQPTVHCHDRIVLGRAPVRFRMVRPKGHSYYRNLSEKLRWGGQPNYGTR